VTFDQLVLSDLESNGMFADQAAAVLAQMKADPSNEPMEGRWQEDVAGYPPAMAKMSIFVARRAALAWIEENEPRAWFKPMFQTESEQGEDILMEGLQK